MRRNLFRVIVLLFMVTLILGIVHRMNQEDVECMVIQCENKKIMITYDELNHSDFSGELIDGKGTVTKREYRGILLRDLLENKEIDSNDYSKITVTSADNYSAEYTVDEVYNKDNIYIAIETEGKPIKGIEGEEPGVQMIVLGDGNSRRCVRFAKIIIMN